MMKKLCLLPLLLFLSFAQAETIYCQTVEVIDGNTFNCSSYKNEQIKIKLYQVDAPKLGQSYGIESQKTLHDLMANKFVTVYVKQKDSIYRYGKVETFSYIAPCMFKMRKDMERHCFGKTLDINETMVQKGMAWSLASSLSKEKKLQKKAQQAKQGLWAESNPIAPWKWETQE